MNEDIEKQQSMDKHLQDKLSVGAVSSRLNVYEYIWSKVFPNQEMNYDEFYDWSRENSNEALELAFEYCDKTYKGGANEFDYEDDFQCCDKCDLPDACSDFGCAIKTGVK